MNANFIEETMNHQLCQGDCLKWLPQLTMNGQFDTIFVDPPDNIGLGYDAYDDNLPESEYIELMETWLKTFLEASKTVWISFNAKWIAHMGRIATTLKGVEIKPCVQTYTFGQHNKNDLGNGHRPLWRFRHPDAPLYPNAIKVPSWRQQNGDKRAAPGGKVPNDVAVYEMCGRDWNPLPNWSPANIEQFLAYVQQGVDKACWEWIGGYKRGGYGRFKLSGKLYGATRLMWRLTHGTDPLGQLVCHTCDNPGCCNPSHLFLGSDADNNQDKERKGRGNHPVGEASSLSKLSEEDVAHVYTSNDSPKVLAKKYNVTDAAIRAIRDKKTWTHITDKFDKSDVFRFPRVTGNSKQRRKWHVTQLNEGLVERCLKLTTPDGGTVCDTFAGTGTTLRVARRCNFNCTLIELDPNYCVHIAAEHRMGLRECGDWAKWVLDK